MKPLIAVASLLLLATTACGGSSSGIKTLTADQLQAGLPTKDDVPAGFTITAGGATTPAPVSGLATCDAQRLQSDLPFPVTAQASNRIVGSTIRYQVVVEQSTAAAVTTSLDSLVALAKACPMLTTTGQDGSTPTALSLSITDGTLAGYRALTLSYNAAGADLYGRLVDVDGVLLQASNVTQKAAPDHPSLDNLASALAGRVAAKQKG